MVQKQKLRQRNPEKVAQNANRDIVFNFPECESCFIEIECKKQANPIVGVLYRHPRNNVNSFNCYLGEFLECFSANNTNLTIFGDIKGEGAGINQRH